MFVILLYSNFQRQYCVGELESESSLTTTAGEKMREVQAAAKQQQALATALIKAGELANICRPLAYVIALRWCAALLHFAAAKTIHVVCNSMLSLCTCLWP
jgi:hypothetical protein